MVTESDNKGQISLSILRPYFSITSGSVTHIRDIRKVHVVLSFCLGFNKFCGT